MDNNTYNKITFCFNLVLYLFLIVCGSILYLFDPISEAKTPWDKLYEAFPILAMLLAFLIPLLLSLVAAKLLKYFWDRFIADILKLRFIDFQEAWSIILIVMLLGW